MAKSVIITCAVAGGCGVGMSIDEHLANSLVASPAMASLSIWVIPLRRLLKYVND
jgi:hypothetical protein